MTLRTVPVATGVVAVLPRAALITGPHVAAEGRRATGHDVAQGAAMRRQQRCRMQTFVDLARRADDVRDLEHQRPGRSEPLHQPVDGIDGGLADLRRQMGVELRGARAGVTDVDLDQAQVHAVFQEMGGVGMPEGVHVRPFVDTALLAGADKGRLQTRARNWSGPFRDEIARPVADGCGKHPLRGSVGPPVRAEHDERLRRQRDVAVPPALAVEVQHAPSAVHVGDMKVGALQQAQPADVDGRQARPIDGQPNRAQDALHFLATQDDGQLLLPGRSHELEELPLPAQRALVEELDPAQRDGETRGGEVLNVREVEEVLAELVFPEPVGRSVEVGGELVDGANVGLLRALGETVELACPRACVGGVASWRPLSGRLAPPGRECAVTSRREQADGTIADAASAIRRRRIEFNFRIQATAARFARGGAWSGALAV